ncbi:MAG: methyltransferase, partial [Planctomycetaceae bacterium]
MLPGFDPASFRDRSARVCLGSDGRVFRLLDAAAAANWRGLQATEFFPRGVAAGSVIGTNEVSRRAVEEADLALDAGWELFLEHERIPCLSYPHEWPFGMLRAAALCQLELLIDSLAEGYTLKDGTAYNVQFRGCDPVFIDVASWEPLPPGAPWTGYGQFCQTQLLPLFWRAYQQLDYQPWLRGRLEGLRPDDFRRCCSLRDWLRPGVFVHGVLHASLQRSRTVGDTDVRSGLARQGLPAESVLRTARQLHRLVDRLQWQIPRSDWSDYQPAYSDADWERKRRFVAEALAEVNPACVWDVGCNTGTFSRQAAEVADLVVALDADHACVEQLYRDLRTNGPPPGAGAILPLVHNFADPSPGLGWRGTERPPLTARSRPDLVLCLAVVHHLVLGSGLRLEDVIAWLAETTGAVVLEFVALEDPQARRIVRNR